MPTAIARRRRPGEPEDLLDQEQVNPFPGDAEKSDGPIVPPGLAEAKGELSAEEAARQKSALDRTVKLDDLASYVRRCFQLADDSRAKVTERLMDCLRRRNGEYDSTRQARIAAGGGVQLYFNITDPKITAARSMIDDVIVHTEGNPWAIEAQELQELPKQIQQQIRDQMVALYTQSVAAGQPLPHEAVQAQYFDIYDKIEATLTKEADKRAERMTKKVEDQLEAGDFYKELERFVDVLVTYPIAIFKGPVIRPRPVETWVKGRYQIVSNDIPTWKAPSPHDFFPSPNAVDPQDSWIIERIRIGKMELAQMRNQKGYSAEAINAVLSEGDVQGGQTIPAGEPQRAAIQNRDTSINQGISESEVGGLEYWGPIQANLLKDWDILPEDADDNDVYQVNVILLGSHVIKAMLNPDPLGKTPYYCTNWEKLAHDIWGRALAEKMSEIQDAAAIFMRAICDNAYWSSRPIGSYDADQVLAAEVDMTKLHAGMMIPTHSSKNPGGGGGDPVKWHDVPSKAAEMRDNADFLMAQADERTGIARYNTGSTDVKGAAGNTASGMSMFLQAASKIVQKVLAHIDSDIIRPAIGAIVRWDNQYLDDEEFGALKGDVVIKPHGLLGKVLKEIEQKRQQDFAVFTSNPEDRALIGAERRCNLLRAIAHGIGLPQDDIVPPVEEVRKMLMEQAQQQAAMMQQGAGVMPPPASAGGATPGAGSAPAAGPPAPVVQPSTDGSVPPQAPRVPAIGATR